MKFAVITQSYNETDLLPQFIAHYERMGASDIVVMFDRNPEMDDVDNLLKRTAARKRYQGVVDYVIMPDVDEFIVPANGSTIQEVLESELYPRDVYFCQGYGMCWHEGDKKYDPSLPVIEQRHYGYRDTGYDKPIILKPEYPYAHEPGFHAINAPFVHRGVDLFVLLHMVAFDEAISVQRKCNQSSRHGQINRKNGCGIHNWDKTEQDHRDWYHRTIRSEHIIKVW